MERKRQSNNGKVGMTREFSTHNDNVVQTACTNHTLGTASRTSTFVDSAQQSAAPTTANNFDVIVWDGRSFGDECCIRDVKVGG